jgi:hypothetical protein
MTSLSNLGAIRTEGESNITGNLTNSSAGSISVKEEANVRFEGDLVQNGSMILAGRATVSGTFSGKGGFEDGGELMIEGQLRPGNSAASVLFDGDLTLNSTANTFIELGGLDTDEFDQMIVTGDFTVDGNLFVSLIDGHSLNAGNSYLIGDILGDRIGKFANFNEGDIVGSFNGFSLSITYGAGDGNDIALISAVPEPSSLLLFGISGLAITLRRRR